ncbi:MAG: GIY-YIG nuclease family protein [Lachnospiraceae bacterium]|nr:GIY-YIG nuclease family protein [Lachnospiraceae bacterium]
MKNYVYILSCADGTFYTGWTTHLEERVNTHNQGKGAKYTRSRRPVKLLYWEEYSDRGEALRREAAIKKMSRKQKEELINSISH